VLLAPAAVGASLPLVPTLAQWVNAGRTPVIMDTTKARDQLGWRPRYDTPETLRALVQ
jgi:nucleoside-diphosphate-sugar epimerase